MASEVTTIKVSKALRARIAAGAAGEGVTAQTFLETVIDEWERRHRLAAVAAAYADAAPEQLADWRAESEAWEATDADGLVR